MERFRDKYRIPSARAKWWNYAGNGLYFITICTAGRNHYFGEITLSVETRNIASLQTTEIGKIALHCWFEIPDHFPFVQLDAFVIMPNHVHGILEINKSGVDGHVVETQNIASSSNIDRFPIETQSIASLPVAANKFGPQSQNLASVIRGYKIGVKKYATSNDIIFEWQTRFHDHIIRNEEEYLRIRYYIESNPSNWEQDKFFVC